MVPRWAVAHGAFWRDGHDAHLETQRRPSRQRRLHGTCSLTQPDCHATEWTDPHARNTSHYRSRHGRTAGPSVGLLLLEEDACGQQRKSTAAAASTPAAPARPARPRQRPALGARRGERGRAARDQGCWRNNVARRPRFPRASRRSTARSARRPTSAFRRSTSRRTRSAGRSRKRKPTPSASSRRSLRSTKRRSAAFT